MKREKSKAEKFLRMVTLYNLYRFLRPLYKRIKYLWRTSAPSTVYWALLTSIQKNRAYEKHYLQQSREYQEAGLSQLNLSNDWFTSRIPHWLSVFDSYQMKDKALNVLEIGSWEGLSSHFILTHLKQSRLTCVDTWEGALEHKDGSFSTAKILSEIESKFDSNLRAFEGRFSKFKGTSFSFFEAYRGEKFDFIYIDGSHLSSDVMIDAIKSFEILRIGGIIIFDDYFWHHYPRVEDNPASAINAFLRLKKSSCRVIRLYYQLAVLKESD